MGIIANTKHLSDWNLGHLTTLRLLTTILSRKRIFQLGLASGIGVWLSSLHQKAFQPGLDTGWNGGHRGSRGWGKSSLIEENTQESRDCRAASRLPAGLLTGCANGETSRPSFPRKRSGDRLGDLGVSPSPSPSLSHTHTCGGRCTHHLHPPW